MKTETITLENLVDTLAASIIIDTINNGCLISHTIQHPTLGLCQTIQSDSDCLLITPL